MKRPTPGPKTVRAVTPETKSSEDFRLFGHNLSAWGTVISLMFSIGAFSITAYYKLLAAPIPQLLPPSAVEIWCQTVENSKLCDPNQRLYIIAASVVWTNRTDSNKGYVVLSTFADVTFYPDKTSDEHPSRTITLWAEHYGENEAVPMQISAQQFVAQRTTFAARRDKNGLENDFLPFGKFRDAVLKGDVRRIRFRFYSEIENSVTVETKCDYFVDDAYVKNIADPTSTYFQRTCFPAASK